MAPVHDNQASRRNTGTGAEDQAGESHGRGVGAAGPAADASSVEQRDTMRKGLLFSSPLTLSTVAQRTRTLRALKGPSFGAPSHSQIVASRILRGVDLFLMSELKNRNLLILQVHKNSKNRASTLR